MCTFDDTALKKPGLAWTIPNSLAPCWSGRLELEAGKWSSDIVCCIYMMLHGQKCEQNF